MATPSKQGQNHYKKTLAIETDGYAPFLLSVGYARSEWGLQSLFQV
jgi:hypothetical protein